MDIDTSKKRGGKKNVVAMIVEDDGAIYDMGTDVEALNRDGFTTDGRDRCNSDPEKISTKSMDAQDDDDMAASVPNRSSSESNPPLPPTRRSSYSSQQSTSAVKLGNHTVLETATLQMAFDRNHKNEDSVKDSKKLYIDYMARMRSQGPKALTRFKGQLSTAFMKTETQSGMSGEMLEEFISYLRALGIDIPKNDLPHSLLNAAPVTGFGAAMADQPDYMEPTELATFAMIKKENGKAYKSKNDFVSWINEPGKLKFEPYDDVKHSSVLGSQVMDFDGNVIDDTSIKPKYVATLVSKNFNDLIGKKYESIKSGGGASTAVSEKDNAVQKKKAKKNKLEQGSGDMPIMHNPAYTIGMESDKDLEQDNGYLLTGVGAELDDETASRANTDDGSEDFGWPGDSDRAGAGKSQTPNEGPVRVESEGDFGFAPDSIPSDPEYEAQNFACSDMRLTSIKPLSEQYTEIKTGSGKAFYMLTAGGLYKAMDDQTEYAYPDEVDLGSVAPLGQTRYLYKIVLTPRAARKDEFNSIMAALRRIAQDVGVSHKKKAAGGCCTRYRRPIIFGVGLGLAIAAVVGALAAGGGGSESKSAGFNPLGSTGDNGSDGPTFAPTFAPNPISAVPASVITVSSTVSIPPSSQAPSVQPSTGVPSGVPTHEPTRDPTLAPSKVPTRQPTGNPTPMPSLAPTASPTPFAPGAVTVSGTTSIVGPVHNPIPVSLNITADEHGQTVNGIRLTDLGSGVSVEYRTSSGSFQSVPVLGGQADIPSGLGEFIVEFTDEGTRNITANPRITNGETSAYTSTGVSIFVDVRCVREDDCARFNGRCGATVVVHRICECDKSDTDNPWRSTANVQAGTCRVVIHACTASDYDALQSCLLGTRPIARRRGRGLFDINGDKLQNHDKKSNNLRDQRRMRAAMFGKNHSKGSGGKAARGGYAKQRKVNGSKSASGRAS